MPLRGKIILAGLVVAAVWLAAGCALAQGSIPWPDAAPYKAWEFGKYPGPEYRGPGFYLSIPKLLASWFMFLLWVRTTNWVAQDCLRVNLNYAVWNPVIFGVFVGAFLLLWLLPFIVGFPFLVIAYLAPLSAYLIVRNRKVEQHQRVMTPAHLRFVFANLLGKFGVKVAAEKVPEHNKGAPVNFKAVAGGGRTAETNLTLAHRSPGYVPTKGMVADLIDRGGDAIMLEYTQQNVAVRYQIDGVWHNVDPLERAEGDTILAVLKTMAGMDPAERVKRQDGTFPAEYKETKYSCRFQSQGVESGERVLLQLITQKKQVATLEELGMRAKTQEQLKELLNRPQGLIIFSSMPAGGLTSLYNGAVKACDRYMRDFAALTDANSGEPEVENVHVTTYNPAGGEAPLPLLQKVVRTYPNVILMRNLADGETATFLCEQTGEERLVFTSLRAKDASESLLRVLMLKAAQKDFANAVIGAASVRLVRKLCNDCKEAYPPPAEILQQLGIPAGKVQTLFRPPSQPDPKKPCPACGGIGYKGRTGMFELLVVDDAIREVLIKSPKVDLVRSTARRAGMKTFQEEGLVLVVKGTTSLAELQRVLKG